MIVQLFNFFLPEPSALAPLLRCGTGLSKSTAFFTQSSVWKWSFWPDGALPETLKLLKFILRRPGTCVPNGMAVHPIVDFISFRNKDINLMVVLEGQSGDYHICMKFHCNCQSGSKWLTREPPDRLIAISRAKPLPWPIKSSKLTIAPYWADFAPAPTHFLIQTVWCYWVEREEDLQLTKSAMN